MSQVDTACLDYLLMEIVPLSIRVSNQLEQEGKLKQTSESDTTEGIRIFENELLENEDVIYRIENYGYSMGLRMSELLMVKQNLIGDSNTRIVDVLDVMKFICRDVWKCLYGKQMDNLRTNHRGTFVLVDSNFKMIAGMNSSKGSIDTVHKAKPYLWFPCGIIRGILMSLGIEASVAAEVTQFPSVSFNIQTTINN